MRKDLLRLRRSLMAIGMSAAMLLTGAGSALAAADGVTTIGTSIASGGNFDLSDTVAGDVITLGDATDTITIAGDTYNAGDIANWNTAFGWGNHGAAGYLVASSNLSDLGSAATARTNLGLGTAATSAATAFATAAQGTLADSALQAAAIGVSVQAYDADLSAWAAVNPSSYSDTATIAAGYQPLDTDLTNIAALATTAYGRGFLALADASAGRTALALGSAAVLASTAFATAAQGTSADTAFGWGDHAAAGYAASGANSDITSLTALTSIDNAGAAFSIGGTNATSITIGRAAVGASFPGGMSGYSLNVGAGGASMSGNLKLWVETGLTAFAGGGQGSATPITRDVAVVSTVASPADSVLLPAAVAGLRLQIINRGANSMDVFPASGESINGTAANTQYAVATTDSAVCVAVAAGDWECTKMIR